jgi:hypothetical protein
MPQENCPLFGLPYGNQTNYGQSSGDEFQDFNFPSLLVKHWEVEVHSPAKLMKERRAGF